jgi:hypothetical protein
VQPFYRCTGGGGGAGRDTIEGGIAGTRSRQGCGVASTSWLDRQESTAAWRTRAGKGGIGGQITGSRPGRWLVRTRWGSHLGTACRGRHRQPGGWRSLPLDGIEQGRGERRERKGRDST